MKKKFVHLHVHTEYSLLDGLSNIKKMFNHVKENGMDSLAITDHGVMYGAIEFYKQAKQSGVKPIIGMEMYTTNVDLRERPERGKFKNYHLLLLAKNKQGYQNLMKLTSIGHLEGYYYRPRVDRETLAKYSKGLICTSACPAGEIANALIGEDYKKAKKIAQWFVDVFKDDYYLEIQRHGYERFLGDAKDPVIKKDLASQFENEKTLDKGVIKLSRELGIPIVATNDAHYIKKEDAEAQDALVCVSTGKNVSDVKRLRFIDAPDFYLKTPKEIANLYPKLPDALENTVKITEKCELKLTLGKWYFPKFPLPKKLSAAQYLRKLVKERLSGRYKNITKEIKERITFELNIIINKGYASYFLIFMDIVNWANDEGIITNTRGSAAGSIVSYILGITTVDPIKHYLPFERFLNPYRPSPPDIDLDVADNKREEILNYIREKYGKDKVAQICTFGRMLSRSSVRDIARVLGYEYSVGDRIAKLIPPPRQGFPITIPQALKEVEELKGLYDSDDDARKILDLATQVEGSARHISVHAAGVVAAPKNITEYTPIQKEPSGEKIITQYEMHACEDVGLIKLDILGIRNLAILGSAIEIVKQTRGKEIDLNKLTLTDKRTFEMLSRGDTMGTFQMGGSGMTRYLKELEPTRVEDLMAMVALYRPGPIAVIPEYIARKKNPKLIKYLDPRMKKYLKASYGLIVYQDDLLFSAIDLAGYDWVEADKFRKAVGKKIPKEMAAQKEKFTKGIIKNGQTKEFAENLWGLFEPFQAYGFNKAHAASYGMVAYQTAYMKANYPVEFMCALLTAESNDTDKIAAAVGECKRIGVEVLPPDINESKTNFTIVDHKDSLSGKGIRFGLGAIKNVGTAAIEAILQARDESLFMSFADFLSRVDNRRANKRVLESLIKVGALSAYGGRAALLSSLEEIRNKVSKPKSLENQQGLFSQDEIRKGMKLETVINRDVEEFNDEQLQNLERQLLGFSLSARPVSELIEPFIHACSHKIVEISPNEDLDKNVKIAGVVSGVRIVVTKRNAQEMAFVRVEDGTGMLDLVVFPKIFAQTRQAWVDNNPLLISGRVESRDETPSLIVETVQTKENLDENKDHLYLRIPKDVLAAQLKELRTVLLNNPGSQKISLLFEGSSKKVELGIKISWSKTLAGEISQILKN